MMSVETLYKLNTHTHTHKELLNSLQRMLFLTDKFWTTSRFLLH